MPEQQEETDGRQVDGACEAMRLFPMRVAREDEVLEPEVGVLADALRHLLGVAHQRSARAAAHRAEAGPQG